MAQANENNLVARFFEMAGKDGAGSLLSAFGLLLNEVMRLEQSRDSRGVTGIQNALLAKGTVDRVIVLQKIVPLSAQSDAKTGTVDARTPESRQANGYLAPG